jgi:pyrroloquinoline quinone (PQQ) biosynthesis protein C
MHAYAKDFTEPILANPFTEPISERLTAYRTELARHPLVVAAQAHELSTDLLLELAFHQYSDSILWIPMLAQMKSKATRSPRLRQAIEHNIAHEAGLGTTSHVQLAVAMMRSLGVTDVRAFPTATFAREAGEWLSDEFAGVNEAMIAGWLLVAESLVPQLFAAIAPCYARLPGCDTHYFTEHIAVDGDEHAAWMAESVADVIAIYGPGCLDDIADGMADGYAETVRAPDDLWRRRCASR